jgi:hypothetical protein
MATNKITFWELLQNNSIEIPIVREIMHKDELEKNIFARISLRV